MSNQLLDANRFTNLFDVQPSSSGYQLKNKGDADPAFLFYIVEKGAGTCASIFDCHSFQKIIILALKSATKCCSMLPQLCANCTNYNLLSTANYFTTVVYIDAAANKTISGMYDSMVTVLSSSGAVHLSEWQGEFAVGSNWGILGNSCHSEDVL